MIVVSWSAIIIVLLIVGAVFGLYRYLHAKGIISIEHTESAEDQLIALATQKKISTEDSWERDWLSAHRTNHQVKSIEPAKLVFKFVKGEQTPREGFAVYCSCGNNEIHGFNLNMARTSYERHLEKEGEKALAAIGRFDMPAGINWELEAKKRGA